MIGQWAGRGGPGGGEGLPSCSAPSAPPPTQSGAPGKVSASARDSPWPLPSPRAPEPRPPRRLLSRDPVPLTLSSTEAQGQGRRRARGRPGRIASSRCECHRTWPPQLPSQGPSRRGILFSVLKTSSGPSQKSASSQNCLTKGPALGTSPNPPGPQLEWGIQEAEISLLALDSSSRTEGGGWANHPNPSGPRPHAPRRGSLKPARASCQTVCLPF